DTERFLGGTPMTLRPVLTRPRIVSTVLAFATALAQTAIVAFPGEAPAVAQAQDCSPQIGIDSPTPGATVSGSADFSGWAVDLASPAGSGVDSVRLYRDAPPEEGGVGLAVATTGVDRPDIDAANNLSGSNSGWTASVDFSTLPSGDYTVYIYAHTMCGWTYATQPITVAAGSTPPPAAAASAIKIS